MEKFTCSKEGTISKSGGVCYDCLSEFGAQWICEKLNIAQLELGHEPTFDEFTEWANQNGIIIPFLFKLC